MAEGNENNIRLILEKLTERTADVERQVQFQEEQIKELKNNFAQLAQQSAETKTLITQVLSQVNNLDNKMFNVFSQITKDNSTLLQQVTKAQNAVVKDSGKERSSQQRMWISFARYVLAITIGVIVAYLFNNTQ